MFVDGCCNIFQDDSWRPVNYQSEESLRKFEAEMRQLGIEDIGQYTYGDYAATSEMSCNLHTYLDLFSKILRIIR